LSPMLRFGWYDLRSDQVTRRDCRPPLDPCQISTKRLNQGVVCFPVAHLGGRRAANRVKEAGFRRVGVQAGAKCGTSYTATADASGSTGSRLIPQSIQAFIGLGSGSRTGGAPIRASLVALKREESSASSMILPARR